MSFLEWILDLFLSRHLHHLLFTVVAVTSETATGSWASSGSSSRCSGSSARFSRDGEGSGHARGVTRREPVCPGGGRGPRGRQPGGFGRHPAQDRGRTTKERIRSKRRPRASLIVLAILARGGLRRAVHPECLRHFHGDIPDRRRRDRSLYRVSNAGRGRPGRRRSTGLRWRSFQARDVRREPRDHCHRGDLVSGFTPQAASH